jgi:ATP/maltotriose-dependent transcriptional regulator MalT
MPPGWQLVLASRTVVPLPTARLRAQGGILEVTADDLSMGPREADSLLKGAGVEADEASVRDLLQRT